MYWKTVQINSENNQRTTDIRSWQAYQKNFASPLMSISFRDLDVEALLFTCRSFSEICSCNFYKIRSYSLLSIFPFILKIFHLDSYKCHWCEESESILLIMEINLFFLSPLLLLQQLWHSAGKLTHSVVQDLWVDLVCLYTASKKLGHARGKHTSIKINKTISFHCRSIHQTPLA